MCGRYYVEDEETIIEMREIINEINRKYSDSATAPKMKTGEIFPTDAAPVLVASGSTQQAKAMRWGFPKWQGSGVVINARSESAAEKSMFRNSLVSRRIVVPTTGFYEWRRKDGHKSKDKFLFRKDGTKMLYLAGVYNAFAREDGTKEERFVILTAAANKSMASYHDRMPVILQGDEKEAWLHDGHSYTNIMQKEQPSLIAQIAGNERKREDKGEQQLDFFSMLNT